MKNALSPRVIVAALTRTALTISLLGAFAACQLTQAGLGSQIDVKAPEVTILGPLNGSYAKGGVLISGTAWDDIGVESVTVTVRAAGMPAQSSTLSPTKASRPEKGANYDWSLSVDTSNFAPAGSRGTQVEVEVKAREVKDTATGAVQKESLPVSIKLNFDNKPPEFDFTDPRLDTITDSAAPAPFKLSRTLHNIVRFTGWADDFGASGLVGTLDFTLGGKTVRRSVTGTSSWTLDLDISQLLADAGILDASVPHAGVGRVTFTDPATLTTARDFSFIVDQNADAPFISIPSVGLDTKTSTMPAAPTVFAPGESITMTISDDDAVDIRTGGVAWDKGGAHIRLLSVKTPATYYDFPLTWVKTTSKTPNAAALPLSTDFSYTFPGDVLLLPLGIYTMEIHAWDDPAGKVAPSGATATATPRSYMGASAPSIVVDNGPPSLEILSPISGGQVSALAIDGKASDGYDVDSVHVSIARDGAAIVATPALPATAALGTADANGVYHWTYDASSPALALDGAYQIDIYAVDKGGKQSGTQTRTVKVDNSKPTLGFGSITPNPIGPSAKVNGMLSLIVLATDANGLNDNNAGVAWRFQPSTDVAPVWSDAGWTIIAPNSSGYTATFSTVGGTDETKYKIWLAARDPAGNVAYTSREVLVSQASDKPVITLSNLDASIGAAANAKSNRVEANGKIIGIVTDDDAADPSTIKVYIDGSTTEASGTLVSGSGTSANFEHDLSAVPEGVHYFAISAADLATAKSGLPSVTGTSGPVYFTVDRNPPTLAITSPAANAMIGFSFTIKATASDANGLKAGAEVQASLDGTNWSPLIWNSGTSTWDWSVAAPPADGSTDGSHSITLRATDVFDKTTDVKYEYTVDTLKPVISAQEPYPRVVIDATHSVVNGSVTVSGTVDETYLARVGWRVSSSATPSTVWSDYTPITGNIAAPSFAVDTLAETTTSATRYAFIYAEDRAGNKGTATVILNIDQSSDKPRITPTNLDPLAATVTVLGRDPTLLFTVEDDDMVDVALLQYRVSPDNGTTWGAWKDIVVSPPLSNGTFVQAKTRIDTTTASKDLDQGYAKVQLRAMDTGGGTWAVPATNHWVETPAYPIAIDFGPPTLSLASPAASAQLRSAFALSGTTQDPLGIDRVEIQVTSSTDSSNTVTYVIDPPALKYGAFNFSGADVTSPSNFASLAGGLFPTPSTDGEYTIQVRSVDGTNTIASMDRRIVIDTQAPDNEFTQPAADSVVNGLLSVKGSVTDVQSVTHVYLWFGNVSDAPAAIPASPPVQTDAPPFETWVDLGPNLLWTVTNMDTGLVTQTYSGSANMKILAVGEDLAGNRAVVGSSNLTLKADQTSDRPIIALTNINVNQPPSASVIGRNGRLSGWVKDDDGVLPGGLEINVDNLGWTAVTDGFSGGGGSFVTWTFDLSNDTIYPQGLHSVVMRARDKYSPSIAVYADAANNQWTSSVRSTETYTFYIDFGPPVLKVTSPNNGDIKRAAFTIQGTATDSLGIQGDKVVITIDGTSTYDVALSAGAYSWNWSLPFDGSADGSHSYKVVATDLSGQISMVDYSVTIDSTPPTADILTIAGSSATTLTVNGTVKVAGTASDNYRLAAVYRAIVPYSGGVAQPAPAYPGIEWTNILQTYSWSWDLESANLPGLVAGSGETVPGWGQYTIYIRPVDYIGNVGAAVGRDVTVDQTADRPSIALTSLSSTGTFEANQLPGSLTVSGSAADDDGIERTTMQIRYRPFDATDWLPASGAVNWIDMSGQPLPDSTFVTWSHDFTGLSDGKYVMQMRASDVQYPANGWSALHPYSWSDRVAKSTGGTVDLVPFAVDLLPPTSTITSPTQSAFLNTDVTIAGDAADANGIKKVTVAYDTGAGYGAENDFNTWTEPYINRHWSIVYPKSNGDGPVFFRVTVTDAFNKTRTYVQSFTVDTAPAGSQVIAPVAASFRKATSLLIQGTANDGAGSGVSEVWYTIDSSGVDHKDDLYTSWTKADDTINWSATASGLTEGVKKLWVKTLDKVGNVTDAATAASTALLFTVDLTVPTLNETTIGAVTVYRNSGYTFGGSGFSTATDALSGVDSLTVSDNGGSANPVTVTAGSWSYVVATAPADGMHTYVFTLTDRAGNSTTMTRSVLVDTAAATAAVTTPTASAFYKTTGISLAGSAIDGAGSGVKEVWYKVDADTVDHKDDAYSTWTKATGTINWSDSATGLAEGAKKLWVKTLDNAGNVTDAATATTNAVTFTVDLTVPTLNETTIGAVTVYRNSGYTFGGSGFSTASDALSGVDTLTVSDNGGTASPVTVTAGEWSHSVSTLPADGTHTYLFTLTDKAGNQSTMTRTVVVDTVAATSTVTTPTALAYFKTTGVSIAGSAFDGAGSGVKEVHYKIDDAAIDHSGDLYSGWTKAAGTVNWSDTIASVSEGAKKLWVKVLDNAGNVTDAATATANAVTFTVDRTVPTLDETTIGAVTVYRNSGYTFGGSGFSTATDALSGVDTLTVSDNGGTASPVTVTAGTWSHVVATAPSDGTHTYLFTLTDKAGNQATMTRTVVVDTVAATSTVTTPTALAYFKTTGVSIAGSAFDGAGSGVKEVHYKIDDAAIDHSGDLYSGWTKAAGTVNWSDTIASVSEGAKKLWVKVLDNAGNVTDAATATANAVTFTVDRTVPTLNETTIGAMTVYRNSVYTFGGSGFSTATDALSGVDTLTVSDNGGTASPVTVTAGEWSHSVSTLPADGTHTYLFTLTDKAGNQATMTRTVVVDTVAATSTVTTPTALAYFKTTGVSIAGSAFDGAGSGVKEVHYKIDDAAIDHSGDLYSGWTKAAGTVNWSDTASGVSEGAKKLWVKVLDNAGNVTDAATATANAVTFTVDRTVPTLNETTIGAVTVYRNSGYTFGGSGFSTATDALSGVDTLTVSDNGGTASPVTVTAGTWSHVVATAPSDGTHTYLFTLTDKAGNQFTMTRTVIVDTSAASFGVSSPVSSGWVDSSGYTIIGSATDGAGSGVKEIWYKIDAAANDHRNEVYSTWTMVPGASSWTANVTGLTEGAKKLWVKTVDNVDNVTDAASAFASAVPFQVDLTPPTLAINPLTAYKAAFSIAGSTSDGGASPSGVAALSYKIDSSAPTSITVGATWSVTLSSATFAALSEGPHNVTVLATDTAGNQTTQSGSFNKDTTPPTLNYSNIQAGGGTVNQDLDPAVSGTLTDASGVASASYALQVQNPKTGIWNTVVSESGITISGETLGSPANATSFGWTASLGSSGLKLPDGKYQIAVTSADIAGNSSTSLYVPFLLSRSSPTVTVTTPTLGSFQKTAFTLVGSLHDMNGVSPANVKAKVASGTVDFSSGTTDVLATLPVTASTGTPGLFTTSLPHGLSNGDAVFIYASTMPVSGTVSLSSGTAYYVTASTPTTFELALTSGGGAIALSSGGSTPMLVASPQFSFVPAQPVTATPGSAILSAPGHGLALGQVLYLQGTALPAPTSAGQAYYVVSVTPDSFEISLSSGGTPITMSGAGSAVAAVSPDMAVSWMVPSMPVAGNTDGSLTAYLRVVGNSGKTTVANRDFTLDTTGPAISITSPKSWIDTSPKALSSATIGLLTISGSTNDPGSIPSGVTGSIQYQIGKNANLGDPASWTSVNVTGGSYSWSIAIGDMTTYSGTSYATECDLNGNPASPTGLWRLPIYFQAVDKAGNLGQLTTYYLILYPAGNIPVMSVSSPSTGLYLSGTQRITGTAAQPVYVHDVEIAVDPAGGGNFPANPVGVAISGSTLTAIGHPFTTGMMVHLAGSTAPQIGGVNVSATADYWVVNPVANSFEVAAAPGGAALTFSSAGSGVTASVWSTAKLSTTGSSVIWYYDLNGDESYPQGAATNQRVTVQVRGWNSTTVDGATRGSLCGLLPSPLIINFNSTLPSFGGVQVAGNTYASGSNVKGSVVLTATVSSSKGVSKIRGLEGSPLAGSNSLYSVLSSYGLTNGSNGAYWTSTVTPPTTKTSGSYPAGNTVKVLITAGGSDAALWTAAGSPAATAGTVFTPNNTSLNVGAAGGSFIESDSSGNFNYALSMTLNTAAVFPGFTGTSTGQYVLNLEATDMGSPSKVSTQTITLNADNYYPTMAMTNPATVTAGNFIVGQRYSIVSVGSTDFRAVGALWNVAGTSFVATGAGTNDGTAASVLMGTTQKIQGTAIDTGAGSGTIGGIAKVVLYVTNGAGTRILDIKTGGATVAPGSLTAKNMANSGAVEPVVYPDTSSYSNYFASMDSLSEIGLTDSNGDGFLESFLINGNARDWWVQLDSTKLPDGPLVVHTVVWDNSGNATHYSLLTFAANTPPSISNLTIGVSPLGAGGQAKVKNSIGLTINALGASGISIPGFQLKVAKRYVDNSGTRGAEDPGFLSTYPNGYIYGFQSGSNDAFTASTPASISLSISGSTITASSHGLSNGDKVTLYGTTAPQIGGANVYPGTGYYVVGATTNTFQVAESSGGAALTFSGSGSGVIGARATTPASASKTIDTFSAPFAEGFWYRLDSVVIDSNGIMNSQTNYIMINNSDSIPPSAVLHDFYQTNLIDKASGHIEDADLSAPYNPPFADGKAVLSGTIKVMGTVHDDAANPDSVVVEYATASASISGLTITAVNHTFANGMYVYVAGTTAPQIASTNVSPTKPYWVVGAVAGTSFQVAEYPGGPALTFSSAGSGITVGGAVRPVSASVTISGATITATAHPFSDGQRIFIAGTTPPQIAGVNVAPETVYYVKYLDANSFQVASSSGGSAVTFSSPGSNVALGSDSLSMVPNSSYTNGSGNDAAGYTYDWAYTWDSSTVVGSARKDVTIRARAFDGKNFTPAASRPTLLVHIVPYISDITTGLDAGAYANIKRSALGRYPIVSGALASGGDHNFTINGFNFNAGTTVTIGGANAPVLSRTATTLLITNSFALPLTTSGAVVVTTNTNVGSQNNANDSSSNQPQNLEGTATNPTLTDDRYISFWKQTSRSTLGAVTDAVMSADATRSGVFDWMYVTNGADLRYYKTSAATEYWLTRGLALSGGALAYNGAQTLEYVFNNNEHWTLLDDSFNFTGSVQWAAMPTGIALAATSAAIPAGWEAYNWSLSGATNFPRLGLGNVSYIRTDLGGVSTSTGGGGPGAYNYGFNSLSVNRYSNLKLQTLGDNTTNYNYVAYYDSATESKAVVVYGFQSGTTPTPSASTAVYTNTGSTVSGSVPIGGNGTAAWKANLDKFTNSAAGNTVSFAGTQKNNNTGLFTPRGRMPVVSGASASPFFDFKVFDNTASHFGFLVYYDASAKQLKIAVNTGLKSLDPTPAAGTAPTTGGSWSTVTPYVVDSASGAGAHVAMAIEPYDAGNPTKTFIHLAYQDSTTGYLKYAFVTFTSGTPGSFTSDTPRLVDALYSAGQYNSIAIRDFDSTAAVDYRPVITTYSSFYSGSTETLRLVYPKYKRVDALYGDGATTAGAFTGKWESIAVRGATPAGASKTFIDTKANTVGGNGDLVVGYNGTNPEEVELLDSALAP